MPEQKKKQYKQVTPDPKYDSIAVAKFINKMMKKGKKSTARKALYGTLDIVKEKTKQDPAEVLEKAIDNATPSLEVRSMRIGGATYQVPRKVSQKRGRALATRWIINAARNKSGSSIKKRLSGEIIKASNKEGGAIKKKRDMHRMAEANKAFAHFAR